MLLHSLVFKYFSTTFYVTFSYCSLSATAYIMVMYISSGNSVMTLKGNFVFCCGECQFKN